MRKLTEDGDINTRPVVFDQEVDRVFNEFEVEHRGMRVRFRLINFPPGRFINDESRIEDAFDEPAVAVTILGRPDPNREASWRVGNGDNSFPADLMEAEPQPVVGFASTGVLFWFGDGPGVNQFDTRQIQIQFTIVNVDS